MGFWSLQNQTQKILQTETVSFASSEKMLLPAGMYLGGGSILDGNADGSKIAWVLGPPENIDNPLRDLGLTTTFLW